MFSAANRLADAPPNLEKLVIYSRYTRTDTVNNFLARRAAIRQLRVLGWTTIVILKQTIHRHLLFRADACLSDLPSQFNRSYIKLMWAIFTSDNELKLLSEIIQFEGTDAYSRNRFGQLCHGTFKQKHGTWLNLFIRVDLPRSNCDTNNVHRWVGCALEIYTLSCIDDALKDRSVERARDMCQAMIEITWSRGASTRDFLLFKKKMWKRTPRAPRRFWRFCKQ